MTRIRKFAENLGYEGILLAAVGGAAICVSVVGFTPFHLANDSISRLILAAVGFVLEGAVFQLQRRASEKQELVNTLSKELGATVREGMNRLEVELLDANRTFPDRVRQKLRTADISVSDACLVASVVRRNDKTYRNFEQALRSRLKDTGRPITIRRVDVIASIEGLERIIHDLLLFERDPYFARYYSAPPKMIPSLNMTVIDDKDYYLGGFYTAESSGIENVIHVSHSKLGTFLSDYWRVLWDNAIPLNMNNKIDWEELKSIGQKLGLSDFAEMEERLRAEVMNSRQRKPIT